MTASLDLTASRNIAWTPIIDLFYPGLPLPTTGATVRMQIRLYPGAPGAAITSIGPLLFEDMAPTPDEPRRRLRISPYIGPPELAGFPTGLNKPEPGEADAYAYDMVMTYADGVQDKLALGAFLLEPGVTLP